jgi:RimJ/RimL family protein N-acetyltransferase
MVMNVSIDKFTTHRLVAERILLSHFSDICRLHSDSQVMKTLSADGNVLDDEATRAGLQQGIEDWQQQGYGTWIFRDKQNKQFIGRAGLKRYSFDGGIEIGLAYAVLSDYWNRGFATEMAAGCLDIGFNQLGFSAIATWTLPVNRASQRVMEKLGFQYERDFVFAGLPHRYYRQSAANWKVDQEERHRRRP